MIGKRRRSSDSIGGDPTPPAKHLKSDPKLPSTQSPNLSIHGIMEKIIKILIEEFNCKADNAQIFKREKEHQEIKEFLEGNREQKKSSMLYICGHPGTGKTSSLFQVLREMESH